MQRLIMACLLSLPSLASAQACWSEWEYKDQSLIRAGQCSENVSIKDFERGFCKNTVEGDVLRSAKTCPQTAKSKTGIDVVTQPIVARCLNIKPPMSGGAANIYYYGGQSYTDSRDSLKGMCVALEGKWIEGAVKN